MYSVKLIFINEEKRQILFLIASGFALALSFITADALPLDTAWIAVLLCGIPIVKAAVIGLVTEFDIKADVLVSLALIASVIIGEIFAAGEIAFIMTIGAMLEERTVAKARAGIEKLVQLTPQTARVINNEQEHILSADQIQVNDILRVFPGETIAVDGVIISGQSSIDQSVMTGESMPVDKKVNDEVFSGTVNQFGTFDMRATKVGQDSSLQRMIQLVSSADAGKAKIVSAADRWATWIVVIALTAAALTWLLSGEIIRAVTILVVFCPCALVLATPTAIMAGIGNATKYGILIREGDALERLSQVKRICFDKTGTLTYGKPSVTAIHCFHNKIDADTLLRLTASAESCSEHPLGKAVLEYYRSINTDTPKKPETFKMLPGRGVYATINDATVCAGNREMLESFSITLSPEGERQAKDYLADGFTLIYVGIDQCFSGFFVLSDTLRTDAPDMIKAIEDWGAKNVLLTGDHCQAATYIGKMAGINDVYSQCLPENKLNAIEAYHQQNEWVCMVGDGINDAPALKKAYVGIAMGGIGSDIAIDAADIALVRDDIRVIPYLLKLAKKTMNTIHINLALSMLLNFVAIILAITGVLNPIVGALVHNIGSVAVIINSALLLHWHD